MNRSTSLSPLHVHARRFIGLLTLALCFPAAAESIDPAAHLSSYNMVVYNNLAYGDQIEAGQYTSAIEKLSGSKARPSRTFAARNNLCVAYVMSRDLKAAEAHCDAAVSARKTVSYGLSNWRDPEFRKDYAVALNNRAVYRALLGDAEGAAKDFEKAASLRTGLTQADANLNKLQAGR